MHRRKFINTHSINEILSIALCTAIFGLCFSISLSAQEREIPSVWYLDANLNDVCFVDPQQGWAVGDHGVIWHTEDGGNHWRQQPSSTTAQLHGIHFVGRSHGWVVGGEVLPYSQRTIGIVLRTTDGGASWEKIQGIDLPLLRDLHFTDARHGWAVGNPSAMFPSGFFETKDGGRSWRSIPAEVNRSWQTLAISPDNRIHVAGTNGTIAVAEPGAIRQGKLPSFGEATLHDALMIDQQNGWIVGDGGLVLQTSDQGISWQPIPSKSPAVRKQFDFHAVTHVGQHLWIAGSPGSVVLHSNDLGNSWEIQTTNHQLPIYAIHFVDELHGYAVGALGTILATKNGGKTWVAQRGVKQRAALLGLVKSTQSISPEVISRLSGAEGYLSVIEVINRFEAGSQDGPETLSAQDKIHQAVLNLGGSQGNQAWQFPMRSESLQLSGERLIESWNEAHDAQGMIAVEQYLVQKIRMWQPEVILTEYADPQGTDALSYLINQMVLVALEKAADANAYPEQITHLKLSPWSVKKVYAQLDDTQQGPVSVNTAQISPLLGMSLAEHAAPARGLLYEVYESSPTLTHFQIVRNTLSEQFGQRDFFAGIQLEPGEPGRRKPTGIAASNLQQLRLLAQRRRNVTNIIASAERRPSLSNAWLAQLGDLTNNLPGESGAEILYHLAMQYHKTGRGQAAADVLQLLVEQYPKHPLAEKSGKWLLQFFSSGEVAFRYQQTTKLLAQEAETRDPTDNQVDLAEVVAESPEELQRNFAGEVQLSGYQKEANGSNPYRFSEKAVSLAKRFERTNPFLLARPELAIGLARSYGDQGYSQSADRLLNRLVARDAGDPWHQAAQTELLLGRPINTLPKPKAVCRAAIDRPILDGHLDEATWQKAEPVDLVSQNKNNQTWPAGVMFAYDNQFLYLAIRCKKAPDTSYSQAQPGPRSHDQQLEDSDRVEICLDTDRDYASYFRLVVDCQGRTFESCFGDASWNPTWYVAATETDSTWTIEAAIPLSALSTNNPQTGSYWALGVQRVAVGSGFQSWSQPASPKIIPQGFGLLEFR